MPAQRKATTETYGAVRITPAKGGYRVRWKQLGKDREQRARTLEQARKIALEVATRLGDPDAAQQPDVLLSAVAASYLDPAHHAGWGTRHREQLVWAARNHILPALGNQRCDALRPAQWQAVLTDMHTEGYEDSTISAVLKVMRSVVKWGKQQGVWAHASDPLAGVQLPRGVRPPSVDYIDPKELPTTAQCKKLEAELAKKNPKYGLMAELARRCGLRWGELLAVGTCAQSNRLVDGVIDLRWQWAEDDHNVELGDPKSIASVRKVVVPKDLAERLTEALSSCDGYLFTSPRGFPLRRSNFNKRVLQPAYKKVGWRWDFHTLRHVYCTSLISLGVPAQDVAKQAGHSTSRVTLDRYVSADGDHLDRVRTLLDD